MTLSEETRSRAEAWTREPFDAATQAEVRDLLARADSDSAVADDLAERFAQNLKFGTGGLRAKMGVGTNRMNDYTLGKAAQGLSDYLLAHPRASGAKPAVALSYDSRINSRRYAREAACIFGANGIKSYIFGAPRPTPMLSTFTRLLGCDAGCMVTASHNPKEYNGFKVFAGNGQQVIGQQADEIVAAANAADFDEIQRRDYEDLRARRLIEELGPEYDDRFLKVIRAAQLAPELCLRHGPDLKIVYTAIHGTGGALAAKALADWGFSAVEVVEAQNEPDGEFPTVHSPNPEEAAALDLAVRQARATEADLVMGTDPDADRVGIAVRTSSGDYRLISGQEVAVLLTYYVLKRRREMEELPANGAVIKTIVTTDLIAEICDDCGVECVETLTGFKYIGKYINKWDDDGRSLVPTKVYLVGGEESYGYLIGTHCRDKDAIVACCTIAEMAAWCRSQRLTLEGLLDEIHRRYGVYLEDQLSLKLEGLEGQRLIGEIMRHLREATPNPFMGRALERVRDVDRGVVLDGSGRAVGKLRFDRENVLELTYAGGLKFTARPSGTEPKIKFYLAAFDRTEIPIPQSRLGERRIALAELIASTRQALRELAQEIVASCKKPEPPAAGQPAAKVVKPVASAASVPPVRAVKSGSLESKAAAVAPPPRKAEPPSAPAPAQAAKRTDGPKQSSGRSAGPATPKRGAAAPSKPSAAKKSAPAKPKAGAPKAKGPKKKSK